MQQIIVEGQDFLDGKILSFNKPFKWTSFDLVKNVHAAIRQKYSFKKIKVGHAGTLDPLATGVMVICTGKATKKITEIQDLKKEYIATLKLGETTPSFDLESEVNASFPVEHITLDLVTHVANDFIGELKQIPPVFSAKNINGVRAYKYARRGEDITLEPNSIQIFNIEIIEFNLPILKIKVECGKGTYIRALARDIGEKLNSGAYLAALERSAIGPYKIENSISIENFRENLNNM
ncbi:MAG: tRNA pseudouridine(55) synthase TruB [Bacteroidales bacterium]|nr:tRNA pseudouridine(55) synthase TruB [Bacteroidales bacterium]